MKNEMKFKIEMKMYIYAVYREDYNLGCVSVYSLQADIGMVTNI